MGYSCTGENSINRGICLKYENRAKEPFSVTNSQSIFFKVKYGSELKNRFLIFIFHFFFHWDFECILENNSKMPEKFS